MGTHEKSVYVAYTGGTIGMERADGGYRPAPGFLARQMAESRTLHWPGMPRYQIREYQPLLDSSTMTPADWVKLYYLLSRGFPTAEVRRRMQEDLRGELTRDQPTARG